MHWVEFGLQVQSISNKDSCHCDCAMGYLLENDSESTHAPAQPKRKRRYCNIQTLAIMGLAGFPRAQR